jgi:ATP-dependent phosphofructokinase / diphosphate-dependent phosphofructokinase
MENIGVFVAGGPAAGINGVTKGIVQEADNHEIRVHGFLNGCEGLIYDRHVLLTREIVEDIHVMGGTILGTSRLNPLKVENGVERILENLRRHSIDGLVAIGGEGTLQLADLLRQNGIPIVHVPKTIDNDIQGIAQTFGFDTAVNEASLLLGAIKLDAESSNLWFVVEIMGRYTGHLAVESGLAAGVTRTLIPEEGTIDVAGLCDLVAARREIGAPWGVILVAESAHFGQGHIKRKDRLGGVAERLAELLAAELEARQIPASIRAASLGYFLRCADPTGFDKAYAAQLGMGAVGFLLNDETHGCMVSIVEDRLVPVPMEQVAGQTKSVNLAGVQYTALKESERYESGRAGLLMRKRARQLAPTVLDWFRTNHCLDTVTNIARHLGLSREEALDTLEDLVRQRLLLRDGTGPDALYSLA